MIDKLSAKFFLPLNKMAKYKAVGAINDHPKLRMLSQYAAVSAVRLIRRKTSPICQKVKEKVKNPKTRDSLFFGIKKSIYANMKKLRIAGNKDMRIPGKLTKSRSERILSIDF